MLCPKCNADHAHRSHRKGMLEHAASLFAYYPYRCRACNHRFMHFRYAAAQSQPERNSSAEQEIRATRARATWKKKRLELLLFCSAALLFLGFLYYIISIDAHN